MQLTLYLAARRKGLDCVQRAQPARNQPAGLRCGLFHLR